MHHSLITRVAAGVAAGVVAGAVFAALSAAPADAQRPRAGSVLSFSGAADAVDIGARGVVLTFGPVTADAASTGSFGGLAGATGAFRSVTVGQGPQSVPAVLTLGGYTFNLLGVPSGTYGQAQCYVDPVPGQRCSPIQTPGTDVSPFELENFATGDDAAPIYSTAQFALVGTVTGPHGAARAWFSGVIATAFPVSFQEALFGLEQAGETGYAGLPYQAYFVVGDKLTGQGELDDDDDAPVTVNPEPSTVAFAAAGLAALAGAARARRRRAA